MRRVEYILLIVVIVIAGIMLYGNNKSKELNGVIAEKQHQIDSIQKLTDSLVVSNDSIKVEVWKLKLIKDSLVDVIGKKKVKIVEYKELRDENSRIVYSSTDSSIVRILSEHEFKAVSKR